MLLRVAFSELNLLLYDYEKSRIDNTIAIDETWLSLRKPHGPKEMMTLAMEIKRIYYFEILPQSETMDAKKYLQFLKKVITRWRGKRIVTVWLLDESSNRHRDRQVTKWLTTNNIDR